MNKFSTPFKEIPCMIVAKNKLGHIITRNSSVFKLFKHKQSDGEFR